MKNYLKSHIVPVFFVLAVFLGATGILNAQVVYRNATGGGNFVALGSRITTLTFAHEILSDTNVLYVGVSNFRSGTLSGTPCGLVAGALTTTVEWDSDTAPAQPMTRINSSGGSPAVLSPDTCSTVEVFRLVSPASGTGTININQPQGGDYAYSGAISFGGVDTSSGTTYTAASGSSSNPLVTVGSNNNDLIFDVLAADFNAFTAEPVSPQQTERWDGASTFGSLRSIGAGSTRNGVSPLTEMSWTLGGSDDWALAGIRLAPAAGTGSSSAIGGQIRRVDGEPLPDTLVILENLQSGEQTYLQTDAKGRYVFEELELRQTYRVSVYNFKYRFSPSERIVSLLDSIDDLDFSGSIRRGSQGFVDRMRH